MGLRRLKARWCERLAASLDRHGPVIGRGTMVDGDTAREWAARLRGQPMVAGEPESVGDPPYRGGHG
jgi:hypothetical protein